MSNTEVSFFSYDGIELFGTFQSANGKHLGNMLFVHGIFAERDEGGFYSEFAQRLANIGISSLRFDFRCHGANNMPLEELSLSGIVNDINAAFIKLEEIAGESPRNFIFASSFGGGVSAYWSKNIGFQKLHTIFLQAPVIDYEWDVQKTSGSPINPQLESNGFVNYVNKKLSRALINEMPYINGIEAISTEPAFNIIIFHGTGDDDVPFESSEKFLSKSEKCKLIRIPDAGHGLVAPGEEEDEGPLTEANYEIVYNYVVDFLKKSTEKL